MRIFQSYLKLVNVPDKLFNHQHISKSMIDNISQDLWYNAVRGRSIDDQTKVGDSRLPDCTFVYRPDAGNIYTVYLFSRKHDDDDRPKSKIESRYHIMRLNKIYAVEQEYDIYRRQKYRLKLNEARDDKRYWRIFGLKWENFIEHLSNMNNYRFSLGSAHQRAKTLAIKKARQVAKKEDVQYIDTIVTEASTL